MLIYICYQKSILFTLNNLKQLSLAKATANVAKLSEYFNDHKDSMTDPKQRRFQGKIAVQATPIILHQLATGTAPPLVLQQYR